MRRALLALLLVLVPAAGCVGEGPDVDPECGGALASPWDAEGAFVRVQALYDARRDAGLCVQFDDGPVLSKRIEAQSFTPHVVLVGEGRLEGEEVRVAAWLIGQNAPETAMFPLTEENYLVIHVDAEGRLRIEKYEEQPVFA